jgi:hypothetical protein
VFYKQGIHISGKYFILEISSDSNNYYFVAFDVENPEK